MNWFFLLTTLCGSSEEDLNFPVHVYDHKVDLCEGSYKVFILYPPDWRLITIDTTIVDIIYETEDLATCSIHWNSLIKLKESPFKIFLQGDHKLFVSDLLCLRRDGTFMIFEDPELIEFILYVWLMINEEKDEIPSYEQKMRRILKRRIFIEGDWDDFLINLFCLPKEWIQFRGLIKRSTLQDLIHNLENEEESISHEMSTAF